MHRTLVAVLALGFLLPLLVMATSPHASAQTGAGRILFMSWRDGEGGIFVMDADGSNQTRLTSGVDAAPVWSPDGCQIVFSREPRDIYVMDADGSHQVLVARLSGDDPAGDLRSYFSPDGSRILFHGIGLGSRYRDLFIVNVDGSNLIRLTNNTEPTWDWGPSWSPDGSKILFESRREGRGIYVMNADGTGAQRLSAGISPAWSPDGSRIAFVSIDQDQGDWVVAVMNADGTNVTPLTDGPEGSYIESPSWSPDGSRIAFKTITPEDEVLLEVVKADGTERRRLADQVWFIMGIPFPVSWSPDGSRVVFTRRPVPPSEEARAGADIYAVDADGSNLMRLTTGGIWPTWSPTARCARGS